VLEPAMRFPESEATPGLFPSPGALIEPEVRLAFDPPGVASFRLGTLGRAWNSDVLIAAAHDLPCTSRGARYIAARQRHADDCNAPPAADAVLLSLKSSDPKSSDPEPRESFGSLIDTGNGGP
jgi:hypothetical protein